MRLALHGLQHLPRLGGIAGTDGLFHLLQLRGCGLREGASGAERETEKNTDQLYILSEAACSSSRCGRVFVGVRLLFSLLVAASLSGAATPPDDWRAINYAPRGHPYFRMLYDWYTRDDATGREVRAVVADDLALLRRSGFNALHLYLWDEPTFAEFHRRGATRLREEAGFAFPDPSRSRRRQWEALDEFVTLAEAQGLWVIPHFVHTPFSRDIDTISRTAIEDRARQLSDWAGAFISHLTPRHANILAWGMLYALEPAPADDPARPTPYSLLWRKLYVSLKARAGATPLVTYLTLPSNGKDLSHTETVESGLLSGYTLNAAAARRSYRSMKRHLREELGHAAEPDLVYTYLFGPDTAAIAESLQELTTGEDAVPVEKLFVAEFGVSAPFGAYADARRAFGENGSPTTDLEGQAVWLRQCLCALNAAGVRKTAYWTLYDAAALWASPVWAQPPREVSLNGHWGLAFEDSSRGFKPAWALLRDFHSRQRVSCGVEVAAVAGAGSGAVSWVTRSRIRPASTAPSIPEPISIQTIVSYASLRPTAWNPGSLVSIFVRGVPHLPGPWRGAEYPLPSELEGLRVDFHGYNRTGPDVRPGALVAVDNSEPQQRIDVQVPWELVSANQLSIHWQGRAGLSSTNFASDWGDFFADEQANAAALHEETGEAVTIANPARSGETVLLFLTNLQVKPPVVPATGDLPDAARPAADYSVKLGDSFSQFRIVADGADTPAGAAIASLRLAPASVGVWVLRFVVPQVRAPQTLRLYYSQCTTQKGPFFPCLSATFRAATSIATAP